MLYEELIRELERIRPKYCDRTKQLLTWAIKAIWQLLGERQELLDRLEEANRRAGGR